jgi:hypothetical protein
MNKSITNGRVQGKFVDDNKTYCDNDSSDYHMIGTASKKGPGMARSSRQ